MIKSIVLIKDLETEVSRESYMNCTNDNLARARSNPDDVGQIIYYERILETLAKYERDKIPVKFYWNMKTGYAQYYVIN